MTTLTQTIDTDQIKTAVDLRVFAAQHGIQLRRNSAKDQHGTCPHCGSEHGLHITAILFAATAVRPDGAML